MPIKLMIKLSWIANGLVALLLLAVAAVVFLTQTSESLYSQEAKEFPPPKSAGAVKKLSVQDYRSIWQSDVNVQKPPEPIKIVTRPEVNLYEKLLKRCVQIQTIMKDGSAYVRVNNVGQFVEELTAGNRHARTKNWLIKASGHEVAIIKIKKGKGILFKFIGNEKTFKTGGPGKEVWLEHKEAGYGKKSGQASPNSEKDGGKTRMIATNHWNLSRQDGREVLQNYKNYLDELTPEVHYNNKRQPVGVRIRRVASGSKAHRFGLRPNDIISTINGSPFNSLDPNYIRNLLKQHRNRKQIIIALMRHGRRLQLRFDVH